MTYRIRCHRCNRPIEWVWRVFVGNDCFYYGRRCYQIATASLTADGIKWAA